MKSSFCLATLALVATSAQAHIHNFVFGMNGAAVVTPTDSNARGMGLLEYNHHTFNYDLDLVITGIALEDLLDTGPNSTPIHIYTAPRGQNGDIALDPGFYGDFIQDGDAIRLTLSTLRIGGDQGAFSTNIFENENSLFDGHLYIQIFTTQYPDGEIRGQIPPLFKFLQSDGSRGFKETIAPPIPAPAPGIPMALAVAGLMVVRRRR